MLCCPAAPAPPQLAAVGELLPWPPFGSDPRSVPSSLFCCSVQNFPAGMPLPCLPLNSPSVMSFFNNPTTLNALPFVHPASVPCFAPASASPFPLLIPPSSMSALVR
ncbi:hypothetical protein ABPG75_005461 [Micractinium tetrahymenae]